MTAFEYAKVKPLFPKDFNPLIPQSDQPQRFRAKGKLLLSGEYFVLDGALALALPSRFGQTLQIESLPDNTPPILKWRSEDADGQTWFEAELRLPELSISNTSDNQIAGRLQNMLLECRRQVPNFLQHKKPLQAITKLEFPRLWGLGSSSTLLYNLAQWSGADPFDLSARTLGGSGYDIACAGAAGPIFYQLQDHQPVVKAVGFAPPFRDQLYFVYLGQKQDSREGIQQYRQQTEVNTRTITQINELSQSLSRCKRLDLFQQLLQMHERTVSRRLQRPTVQALLFPDFPGVVKSLGAWGGDFVLAASDRSSEEVRAYFNRKGFEVFLKYEEMIK